jgi:hypothetical protein
VAANDQSLVDEENSKRKARINLLEKARKVLIDQSKYGGGGGSASTIINENNI